MVKKIRTLGYFLPALFFLWTAVAASTSSHSSPNWATPLNLSNTPEDSQQPHLAYQDGALYLAWLEPTAEGGIAPYFAERPAGSLTWTLPISLSTAPDQTAVKIRLQGAADGATHVAWQATDPSSGLDHVYYVERPSGGAWGQPEQLSGSSQAVLNDLKVDSTGVAHALWEEVTISGAILLYAGRQPGLDWDTPLVLDLTADLGAQAELVIGLDDHLHALWTSQSDTNSPLVYAERPPGQPWTSPVLIASGPADPTQLEEQGGHLFATWVEETGQGDELHFAERALGATWTAPAVLAGPHPSIRSPLLNVTPLGRPALAWIGRADPGGPQNVYFQERLADGVWSAAWNLSDYSDEAASISRLRLDSHTSLIGHVAWVGRASSSTVVQVYHRARLLSGEWTAAEGISASAAGVEAGLALAMSEVGQVHVVWEDTTPGAIDLFYNEGGAVGLSTMYLPAVLNTADPR